MFLFFVGGLRSPKRTGNTYNALQEDIESGPVSNEQTETEIDDDPDKLEKGGYSWKNFDTIEKEEEEIEIKLHADDHNSDLPYFDHAAVTN